MEGSGVGQQKRLKKKKKNAMRTHGKQSGEKISKGEDGGVWDEIG